MFIVALAMQAHTMKACPLTPNSDSQAACIVAYVLAPLHLASILYSVRCHGPCTRQRGLIQSVVYAHVATLSQAAGSCFVASGPAATSLILQRQLQVEAITAVLAIFWLVLFMLSLTSASKLGQIGVSARCCVSSVLTLWLTVCKRSS